MNAVDLFAGLGGWTEGATQAGVRVLWAANHWRPAVDWHSANHPATQHVCQDLRQADWTQLPAHDIGLFSPSCKGHTHARGKDRPCHDAERATAWAVVDCAECHRQPFLVVENVLEFLEWELYPAWELALQKLGYTLSVHRIDAADHGVPQHRERAIVLCTRSKAPLVLDLPRRPHVPAETILEKRVRWSPVHTQSRASKTLARWKRGRAEIGRRFIMPYYSSGSGLTGRSLDRPLGTVTTVERFALVDGDRMRMFTVGEYRRAMSFPDGYKLPDNKRLAVHLLGNAVCPVVARDIIEALRRAA